MSRIHDNLPTFCFGLWNECPEHAPVAWGARGIADRGTGFSLLPDRQTMITFAPPPVDGKDPLRDPFSRLVLNKGPIERANRTAKRLRSISWHPHKDLEQAEFAKFYYARFQELKAEHKNPEDWLFEDSQASWVHRNEPKISREDFDRLVHEPDRLYRALQEETKRKQRYYDICNARIEKNPNPAPPRPPKRCENDEEECDAEFKRIKRGEYTNCYYDGHDAWVCDECGYAHYIEWTDDEDNPDPGQPILHAFEPLIGEQRQSMFHDKSETFTLFDDQHLKILGNTNASHGYVYLIAFPTHEVIDLGKIRPSEEHPGFENDQTLAASDDVFWSGKNPPPMPGQEVVIECNQIGKALVFGHMVFDNFLHLNVLPLDPPDFYLDNVERSGNSMLTNVTGSELG